MLTKKSRVRVRVSRNPFNHAQTARFNIPTFLPLLQTMSSLFSAQGAQADNSHMYSCR